MTESAAILIWLADLHPESGLSPRCRIKPDVRRIGVPPAQRDAVVETVHPRIAACRAHMYGQLASPSPPPARRTADRARSPCRVVSRFGPWRDRFHAVAPRMTPAVRRLDEHPRLIALWRDRFADD